MPTKAKAVKKKTSGRAVKPSGPKHVSAALPVETVKRILENYAEKAVFRSFSPGPADTNQASFKMLWHYDRRYELILDIPKRTLRFPAVLPGIPPDSQMYREFKQWLTDRQSKELPVHRRTDPAKARLRCSNRRGEVSVSLTVLDGDFEYGARKIVHTVHEIFLIFLADGPYYEYLVEQLGLDQDQF